MVASSKAQFLQKEYVYDSGWSDASASSGVEPAGLPECLTDNGLYYWAVQVRDSQGLESELSQPEMCIRDSFITHLAGFEQTALYLAGKYVIQHIYVVALQDGF